MLGGDGISTYWCEHLAFQLKAAFLYSSAEKFCAKLIESVCLKEIVKVPSDDHTASPIQEPRGN